jgi:hypothetical protein
MYKRAERGDLGALCLEATVHPLHLWLCEPEIIIE